MCLLGHPLSINGQGEDNTATGDLDILDDLTIIGAGMDKTIIDGGGIDRVFHLVDDSSCNYFEVTVSDLTIQNGECPNEGGGILSDCWKDLTIVNVMVRKNVSTSNGGGMLIDSNLMMTNTIITQNTAGLNGGGIFNNQSTIMIVDSEISRNVASQRGGGVLNNLYGSLDVSGSTISGNSAEGEGPEDGGGGIYNSGSTIILTNSTISGNKAFEHGGGIYNENVLGVQSVVSLYNVTMYKNSADQGTDSEGDGGGIYNNSDLSGATAAPVVSFQNTIIAGNIDPNSDPDCYGIMTSQGYNLIQTISSNCTITGSITGNIYGEDPGLISLRDNGGPTETHGLSRSSPVIDAGNPGGCKDKNGGNLSTDQRDYPRPVDGDGDNTATCDIGAFEFDGFKIYLPQVAG